jgi:drug/metabolite transporter (DMT)-like permease
MCQIFVLYKLADPGTVQLVRSGVTFITALVMVVTLKSKISKIQWISIIIQVCLQPLRRSGGPSTLTFHRSVAW